MQTSVSSLNAALQSMASDIGVTFLNHHDLFHLGNGNVNGGYFYDGVHLSHKGCEALCKSMGLRSVEGCKNMLARYPVQTKPRTWQKTIPGTAVVAICSNLHGSFGENPPRHQIGHNQLMHTALDLPVDMLNMTTVQQCFLEYCEVQSEV